MHEKRFRASGASDRFHLALNYLPYDPQQGLEDQGWCESRCRSSRRRQLSPNQMRSLLAPESMQSANRNPKDADISAFQASTPNTAGNWSAYRRKGQTKKFDFFWEISNWNALFSLKLESQLAWSIWSENDMSEEAGRRRVSKKPSGEVAASSSSPAKPATEDPISPRTKDATSVGRTRLGSASKEKDSPSKGDKDKPKTKDKDKESRNKHALSRTAQRQNSIMPVPMPSPDKVEEIFKKLLVRALGIHFSLR